MGVESSKKMREIPSDAANDANMSCFAREFNIDTIDINLIFQIVIVENERVGWWGDHDQFCFIVYKFNVVLSA